MAVGFSDSDFTVAIGCRGRDAALTLAIDHGLGLNWAQSSLAAKSICCKIWELPEEKREEVPVSPRFPRLSSSQYVSLGNPVSERRLKDQSVAAMQAAETEEAVTSDRYSLPSHQPQQSTTKVCQTPQHELPRFPQVAHSCTFLIFLVT